MKTTTITPPSQAKELAEKQTKNPDFTHIQKKVVYLRSIRQTAMLAMKKKYQ